MNLKSIMAGKILISKKTTSGNISITLVTGWDELKSHGDAWDKLLLELPLPLPMLSYCWVVTALQHFLLPDEEWACLMAYDQSILVGVFPLIIGWRYFGGIRRVQLHTPFNWHFLSVDCLVKPGYEDEVVLLMLKAAKKLRPSFLELTVTRVENHTPLMDRIRNGIKGFVSVRRHNGSGSYIEVSGTYEKYMASLDTKFVRNLRRLDRKMESLNDLEISVISDNAGDNQYFERFLNVESESWKGKKGSAIMQSPSLVKFYSDLTRRLGERGWLEWYFLSAEGNTIAALMTVRVGRRLIIYKIGYEERYASYSPGNKLFEKMVQRVYASGEITEIDCLTSYPWNRNWNMTTREFYDLAIFPTRPIVLLTGYLPARIFNYVGQGSYLRNKCRMIYDVARPLLARGNGKTPNGNNGISR
jgi:hypothetical protein